MNLLNWIEFCTNQHDVVCNQKYDRSLPYSFHLSMVYAQAKKFIELVPRKAIGSGGLMKGPLYSPERENVFKACWGHDLIEDARLSYNDIVNLVGNDVADIIFLCTEMRGRNRGERKNDQFYSDLAKNELAVFVKLCDIMANSLYSVMSGSSMLIKQKEEWPGIKGKLLPSHPKFQTMFDYLDKIYGL